MNKRAFVEQTYFTLLAAALPSGEAMVTEGDKQTATTLGETVGQIAAMVGSAAYDEIEALVEDE